MVRDLSVTGGGMGPQSPFSVAIQVFALAGPSKRRIFYSCRAFQSDYCLESLQGPLKYYTIQIMTLKVHLKWVSSLNCLGHGHGP